MRESSSLAHKYETRLVSQAGTNAPAYLSTLSVTKNNFFNIKVLLTNGTPEITRARKIATLNDDCKFGLVFANQSTIFLSTFVNTRLYRG